MNTTQGLERDGMAEGQRHRTGLNLLRIAWLRRLVLSPLFPKVVQAALLVVFAALCAAGWGVFPPSGTNTKAFAKSHAVTLLVWGLWWPAMVWAAVLFGRVWCAICPLELFSSITEWMGRALGIKQRPIQRWIASGALIAVLYALLQLSVAGAEIHRIPAYTSVFLLSLFVTAGVTGLVFKNRGFCRGFCPVGLLLNTYGRGGMVAVRPSLAGAPGTPNAKVCPSLLNPSALNSNAECLLCARCIKSGSGADTMELQLRRPYSRDDSRPAAASWSITVFVMMVSGFVLAELCTEWPAANRLFLRAPAWAAEQLHVASAAGWFKGAWTILVVPVLFWLPLAAIMRLGGEARTVGEAWRKLALPFAALIAAGHMAKGLAKFATWAPNARGAIGRLFDAPATAAGKAWLPMTAVAVIGCILVGLGLVISVREYLLASRGKSKRWASIAPFAAVGAGFVAIIAGWTTH